MSDLFEDPVIPNTPRLRYHRDQVRNLTDQDPVVYGEETIIQGNAVQVAASLRNWLPKDYTYRDHSFTGAIVAAEKVVDKENLHAHLEIGSEHLEKHRKALRRLTEME